METRTPLIGVTRCSRLDDYLASIERSGGRSRILEVTESARTALEQVDAVLLTGGGDVDPAFYRQARHPSVHDAEPGRDEFEIDLARRAIDGDVPLLAICRGAQVLNVAAGGTLIQDIPSEVTTEIGHSVDEPKDAIAHTVRLSQGSLLEAILGGASRPSASVPVNSRHHQAVAEIAPQFSLAAAAPDGVVEAIELAGGRFCLGIQWHPENFWSTGEFKVLFDSFAAAAAVTRR